MWQELARRIVLEKFIKIWLKKSSGVLLERRMADFVSAIIMKIMKWLQMVVDWALFLSSILYPKDNLKTFPACASTATAYALQTFFAVFVCWDSGVQHCVYNLVKEHSSFWFHQVIIIATNICSFNHKFTSIIFFGGSIQHSQKFASIHG